MKAVTEWAERIYSMPEFQALNGTIHMCQKALKPVCIADPVVEKKKEEKKVEAPVAKPAAKILDNV
jgi:hypothetical protein